MGSQNNTNGMPKDKNRILEKYYSAYSDKDGFLDLLLAYLFVYWLNLESVFSFNV